MSREITESDWTVFRQLHAIALDRFCWRVLDEIQQVTADTKRSTHERYLAVYDLVQRHDREIADAFSNPRRSTAVLQLISIQSHQLLTEEELERFSPELRERLKSVLD